jgi:xanthosine utilization system XapX-like protein
MSFVKYLAVLPFLGILVGVPLLNRVEPLIFGMPLILAWIVLWVILTAVIMAIIYRFDPANLDAPNRDAPNGNLGEPRA